MHADIDLDRHAQRAARSRASPARAPRRARRCPPHDRISDRRQRGETARLRGANDLVVDQDVADTDCRQHLGLAQLRAGHTDGAGRQFLLDDLGRLLPLGVRAPANAVRAAGFRHAPDIRLHQVEIDQQRRRIDICLRCANQ